MSVSLVKKCHKCINGIQVADRLFTYCAEALCDNLTAPCVLHECYVCHGLNVAPAPDQDAAMYRLDPWGEMIGARVELNSEPQRYPHNSNTPVLVDNTDAEPLMAQWRFVTRGFTPTR